MKTLSASSLSLYSDCSLKWKFRYIDKINKFEASIHLIYGSAIHKALEKLNLSLAHKKNELEDVFQDFYDEWNKQIKDYNISPNKYSNQLFEMGINALEKFYNEKVDYELIGAETKFKVPIIYPDGKKDQEYELYGLIDAIVKRKNEIMIIDYKTSKESYNRFKLDTSLQLAIYAYAFRQMLKAGKFPNIKKDIEDYISYYVLIKDYDTLDGDIKMQRKKITDKHLNRMFYIIQTSIKGIKEGIFLPNYASMCNYCEFKQECLEFGGK